MQRTRVTILCGFLGAGKTTLLNALLRDTPEPLGVIVNDFGAVNVDAALVAGKTAVEGEIALQNGCICCTIRTDLLAALLSLTRRAEPPGHIVIETSGVSDPAAVARTVLDPRLSDHLELAAIIGCVDPSTFASLVREDWSIASNQLRVCDFVVLTKADVTSQAERVATQRLVETLAPRARRLDGSLTEMPTSVLLGSDVLWANAKAWRAMHPRSSAEAPHVHEVGHAHGHAHTDGHAFETWTYRTERPLSIYALRRALADLPREVFRAKGFARIAQDPGVRVLVQVVGGRAELREAGGWDKDPPQTALVFLGREGRLPVPALERQLDGARDDGSSSGEQHMADVLGYFNRLLSTIPAHGN